MTAKVYCVSSARPGNVQPMAALLGEGVLTWVVPAGQGEAYEAEGAPAVIEVKAPAGCRPLAAQRNAALDDAHSRGLTCIQTDDDLRKLEIRDRDGKAHPAHLGDYLAHWDAAMSAVGARLGGCAPTPNPFYSDGGLRTDHFIMGQLFAVAPTDLRFDTGLGVREDYDYTARHWYAYGCVARCDALLPTYQHWSNPGGCQDYRSPALDEETNRALLARWPNVLAPHPSRPGELMFRVGKVRAG